MLCSSKLHIPFNLLPYLHLQRKNMYMVCLHLECSWATGSAYKYVYLRMVTWEVRFIAMAFLLPHVFEWKDDASSRDRFISHSGLASDNPLKPGEAFQECGVMWGICDYHNSPIPSLLEVNHAQSGSPSLTSFGSATSISLLGFLDLDQ